MPDIESRLAAVEAQVAELMREKRGRDETTIKPNAERLHEPGIVSCVPSITVEGISPQLQI